MRQELMAVGYKLKLVDKSVNALNVNVKKNEIVQREISNLDGKTKLYDRCGRM